MSIKEIEAIDVHGHYGEYSGAVSNTKRELISADPLYVIECAKLSNVRFTIVSPLIAFGMEDKCKPVQGNDDTANLADTNPLIFQWVVIHPDISQTFEQARERLKNHKCLGIKIHPECHKYRIKEKGKMIFEFAATNNATVISHSGEVNSKPEDFVDFANEYPNINIIMAHLGCTWDDDPFHHVHAIIKSKYGNLYTDTSSATSITPRLIERAVRDIGSDKILFGTDIPCYFSPMQRARIDNAFIEERHKENILYKNAIRILNIAL